MISELKEFLCECALRPNDFDWSNHLNNSVYAELFEIGRWQWSLHNGIDYRQSSVVAVVVRLEIDYIKQIEWDPILKVNVRTSIERIENYSFFLNQNIESKEGSVMAKGKLRLALFDRDSKKPIKVDIRSILGNRD